MAYTPLGQRGKRKNRTTRTAGRTVLVLLLGTGVASALACTATIIEEAAAGVEGEPPPGIRLMDGGVAPPQSDRGSDPVVDAAAPTTDGVARPPTPAAAPNDECGTPVEQEELALTNAARGDSGLPPLTCDLGLTRAARKHSEDMCSRGYFSHTSLDGRRFDDRLREESVAFGAAAENIARGQETARGVHEGWMMSSGHRANILDGSYRRIGIGYAACPSGALWTQDFTD